jgi:DNA invertase Pin-like site-specific DNA recombinase/predicted Zn-dependent protease
MVDSETYKVGIYLRLSREDERLGESGSITTQRELLLNYIKDNNLIFIDEYIDDGISGTTFDRDGFKRMIKDVEDKKINMIITKDTSRLGRDHIEFGYYVEKYFPEKNIRYVAVTDGIDTSINSTNNDMLLFKSAFNDMYVKDISNKIRASLYTKKRNGKFVGQTAPYGYKKDPNDKHKLVIDEEAAFIVRKIFNLFVKGTSLTEICNTLTKEGVPIPSVYKNMNRGLKSSIYGVWGQRTVSDMLQNPTYIGDLTQGRCKKVSYKSKKMIHTKKKDWIIAENSCPAIIDKETFELVQHIYMSNRNRKTIKDNGCGNLLLRGFIYCKECHHTIGFRKQIQYTKAYGTKVRIYGNCNYWSKHKKDNACTPHSVKYEDIESNVLEAIKDACHKYLDTSVFEDILKKNSKSLKLQKDLESQVSKLKNEITLSIKKIDDIYNDKLNGIIDLEMYKRIYNNITGELISKEKELSSIEEKLYKLINNTNDNHELYKKIVKEFLSLKSPSRALLSNLIKNIEIDENKNIEINYKIKLF